MERKEVSDGVGTGRSDQGQIYIRNGQEEVAA